MFYPIKKRNQNVPDEMMQPRLSFPETRAMTRFGQWLMTDQYQSDDLSKFGEDKMNTSLKIPAWYFAEYDLNHQKLPLIIFIHGLGSDASNYIGHYMELASHGYLIFAVDTNDGSCNYTQTEKGEIMMFDTS